MLSIKSYSMEWNISLVTWGQLSQLCPLLTSCAPPAYSRVAWEAEKALNLCQHCSAITKTLLCYQDCSTNTKHSLNTSYCEGSYLYPSPNQHTKENQVLGADAKPSFITVFTKKLAWFVSSTTKFNLVSQLSSNVTGKIFSFLQKKKKPMMNWYKQLVLLEGSDNIQYFLWFAPAVLLRFWDYSAISASHR